MIVNTYCLCWLDFSSSMISRRLRPGGDDGKDFPGKLPGEIMGLFGAPVQDPLVESAAGVSLDTGIDTGSLDRTATRNSWNT